jgi:hypothetical protein
MADLRFDLGTTNIRDRNPLDRRVDLNCWWILPVVYAI